MKASRKTLLALVGAMAVGAAFAAPSVEILSVQQQYPWTNTVDIVYQVAGVASETNGYFVVFTPTTSAGAEILDVNGEKSVQVALKGSGVYSTQWFPQTNQQYTACKMTPSVFRGAAKDYMIVDLETWAVTYEAMATQEASNQRYNTDEYKTKKLVLRRIEGNKEYWIGEKGRTNVIGHGINTYHKVSVPQDYYMTIFCVTDSQWRRLTNATITQESTRPSVSPSYNVVRGNALPNAAPTNGGIANLNARTKAANLPGTFDVTTETMWEIAARAGCTTVYLWGDSASGWDDWAWQGANSGYSSNRSYAASVKPVGLKKPNDWGFYDIHGNVWEWQRDTFNSADLATLQTNLFVPVSTGASAYCVYKSTGINTDPPSDFSHLSGRHQQTKAYCVGNTSFRLAFYPQ